MTPKQALDLLFVVDPTVGFFSRGGTGRPLAGERAGYVDVHGYRRITINGVKLYEHHLIWFYCHGEWPTELDHRDGDRSNNAITNLRHCDRSENNFNAERTAGASGLRGAYLDKRNLQWYSKIQIRGQVIFLGNFSSAEEAHEAFLSAAEQHHGEFAYARRYG